MPKRISLEKKYMSQVDLLKIALFKRVFSINFYSSGLKIKK